MSYSQQETTSTIIIPYGKVMEQLMAQVKF